MLRSVSFINFYRPSSLSSSFIVLKLQLTYMVEGFVLCDATPVS